MFYLNRPSAVYKYEEPRYWKPDTQRALLEKDARALLHAKGIFCDVRFQHATSVEPIPQEYGHVEGTEDGPWIMDTHRSRRPAGKGKRASKAGATRKDLRKAGKRACDEERAPRKRGKCMVTHTSHGWTCNHPGWTSGIVCWHIREAMAMLGVSSRPYSLAKRRKPTMYLFNDGPSEQTRRSNARDEQRTRVPQIFAEICERLINPAPRVGRTGLPLKAVAYLLLMKVYLNLGYLALVNFLRTDEIFWRLAANWAGRTPAVQTICNRFGPAKAGAPKLDEYLDCLIAASAKPGREIDRMFRVDSDQIPTIMCDNSRDRKFAGPLPSYRRTCERIKRHIIVGDVSKLIASVNVTLDFGLGSNDGPHLVGLAERALEVLPNATKLAADKAYSLKRCFKGCEELGIDLYVPEKASDRRLDAAEPWPESAQRIARLQRTDPQAVYEVYRMRSDVEGTPSSSKRRNPNLRLRPRRNDPDPVYPAHIRFNDNDELEEKLSSLDEETIHAILDAARTAVGAARLNEALATIIVSNVCHLVTLEHLYDQRIDFDDADFAFRGIRMVKEQDLRPDR